MKTVRIRIVSVPLASLCFVLLSLALATRAVAQEIRLDLNELTILPANWNTVSSNTTVADLLDFGTGVGTGVDVTTANFEFYAFDPNIWTAGDKGWVAENGGKGAGFRISAGTATVTFDKLPGGAYRVQVVASNRTDFPGSVADIQVNGSFADADEDGTGENGDDYPLDGNGHNNWLIWNAVAPSAGQIQVSMAFASGGNGTVINAIRLVPFAQAGPAMFRASFIFHARGNDISGGIVTPYISNDWTALPLGYDCQHASPTTTYDPRYCTPAIRQRGHPATGSWTRTLLTTGTPRSLTLMQSDFGVAGVTGFRPTFTPYLQSFTYATFVNAAGSFFAGGGAAAGTGYNNRWYSPGGYFGTWHIRAGKNAFGGAMGLLGKLGAQGDWSPAGGQSPLTLYSGLSSWAMVPVIGRTLYNTIIGTTTMGKSLYQNPYIKTDMWYAFSTITPMGLMSTYTRTFTAIGSGTLWTTGQVGNFAKSGFYPTSAWRTGYDNRTAGGLGTIRLVTPTLVHWLSSGFDSHTAQIGMLTIRVPEPGAVVLLAAGVGVLVVLRRSSRRA
jgi:hypothetical protein